MQDHAAAVSGDRGDRLLQHATASEEAVKSQRAFATLIILGVVALLGVGTYGAIHFGLFSGESKRAKTGTQTTETLVAVNNQQDAKAGAVFAKIGDTNAEAPDSPQKKVIARFVPIGLSLTGEPDAAFMLELEKLKSATLQGRIDQADKINADIMKDTAQLRRELAAAVAAKRASDLAIQQAADKDAARDGDMFILICITVAAIGLFLYVKITHASPGALARIVTDLRSGAVESPAVAAVDGATTPLQQMMVKGNVWFNSKVAKLFS